MDIKLKKSNIEKQKKLASVIIPFLICTLFFTASITIGMTSVLKEVVGGGDPLMMLSSKEFETSGILQEDLSSNLNDVFYGSRNMEDHNYVQTVEKLTRNGVTFFVQFNSGRVLTNMDFGGDIPNAATLNSLGANAGAYRIYTDGILSGNPSLYERSYSGDHWMNELITEFQDYGYGDQSAVLQEDGTQLLEQPQTVYVAMSSEALMQMQENYTFSKTRLINGLILAASLAFVCLISFIALCMMCGKKDAAGQYQLAGIDRWFTELLLGLLGGALFGTFGLQLVGYENSIMYMYSDSYRSTMASSSSVNMLVVAGCAALLFFCSVVGLRLIMALVVKIKAGCFFRDFLVVKASLWIWTGLKDIYYGSSIMKKVIILVFLMCLCSATVIFFPVVVIVSLVFAARWVKQYEEIKNGVALVKNGNSSYKIPIDGNALGELQLLAADINAISEGFDLAVKQELKNQRMKTELISNVSHDIKTPLTSIISYVDLLKKEGLDSKDAPKYLEILEQKSERLKKLTEDLFEAAKASSGDIPVNLEKVEVMSLLNQTLAELSDRLDSKGLEVIVKAEKEKFFVAADGQLLWRVLENLFGNASKYALENSRVYVDIGETQMYSDGRMAVVLEMKNISKNPLNIPAEELMERFKRGDEARSTEGSGLGLSIARDLISMQHGKFNLVIDGDLFKAVIMLEVCQ